MNEILELENLINKKEDEKYPFEIELNELESSYKNYINHSDERHLLDLRKQIELIKSKIKEIFQELSKFFKNISSFLEQLYLKSDEKLELLKRKCEFEKRKLDYSNPFEQNLNEVIFSSFI